MLQVRLPSFYCVNILHSRTCTIVVYISVVLPQSTFGSATLSAVAHLQIIDAGEPVLTQKRVEEPPQTRGITSDWKEKVWDFASRRLRRAKNCWTLTVLAFITTCSRQILGKMLIFEGKTNQQVQQLQTLAGSSCCRPATSAG